MTDNGYVNILEHGRGKMYLAIASSQILSDFLNSYSNTAAITTILLPVCFGALFVNSCSITRQLISIMMPYDIRQPFPFNGLLRQSKVGLVRSSQSTIWKSVFVWTEQDYLMPSKNQVYSYENELILTHLVATERTLIWYSIQAMCNDKCHTRFVH